jgi:hypothetical protein
MKTILFLLINICFVCSMFGQIDPELLRKPANDSGTVKLNMDAVYDRPFKQAGKLPVALGGYAESNYKYEGTDGISEGHQFQFRRLTLFVSSAISHRLKFLSEIEFEEGGKEINIEFASLDFEVAPLLNFRGGVILNPIGSFNQNHDGPKWEFVERPLSATQLLPATFSNVGFGLYGKKYSNNWVFGYEAYLSNGFNERIINNSENRTFLPAVKEDPERFEESFNGSPLLTAKVAIRNRKIGELGISYMRGAYNKFQEDGIVLDKKRYTNVFALDFNTTVRRLNTFITAEFAFISVDIAELHTEQFGRRQHGGFIDIVQPIAKFKLLGWDNAVLNLALRGEYVDWNTDRFKTTSDKIGDQVYAISPAISFRPSPLTVFRLNYRYSKQKDLLSNPASKTGGILFGLSTYF